VKLDHERTGPVLDVMVREIAQGAERYGWDRPAALLMLRRVDVEDSRGDFSGIAAERFPLWDLTLEVMEGNPAQALERLDIVTRHAPHILFAPQDLSTLWALVLIWEVWEVIAPQDTSGEAWAALEKMRDERRMSEHPDAHEMRVIHFATLDGARTHTQRRDGQPSLPLPDAMGSIPDFLDSMVAALAAYGRSADSGAENESARSAREMFRRLLGSDSPEWGEGE
jgi:hypothetical protein